MSWEKPSQLDRVTQGPEGMGLGERVVWVDYLVPELSLSGQPSRDAGWSAGCWVLGVGWERWVHWLHHAATGLEAIPQQWGSPCRHPHLPPIVSKPGESSAVCL